MKQTVVVNGVSGARGPEGPEGPQGQASSRLVRRYDFTNPDDFFMLNVDVYGVTLSARTGYGPKGTADYLGGSVAGTGAGEVSSHSEIYCGINLGDEQTALDTLDPPLAAGDVVTLVLAFNARAQVNVGTPPAAWVAVPTVFQPSHLANGRVMSAFFGSDENSVAGPTMLSPQYSAYAGSWVWDNYSVAMTWSTQIASGYLDGLAPGDPIIGTYGYVPSFYLNYFPENGADITFYYLDVFVDRAPA